jgi:hypothetical protein
MQELQKTTTENQLANITTKEDLVKQLYHVNYLVSYPVSDLMLEGWANSIMELVPEITTKDIKSITDRMKMGTYPFDSRKGIQNIFNGYVLLLKDRISWYNKEKDKALNSCTQNDSLTDIYKQFNPIIDDINKIIFRIQGKTSQLPNMVL